jgi:membrane-associated protease RseP (regulator of RpoE activity)
LAPSTNAKIQDIRLSVNPPTRTAIDAALAGRLLTQSQRQDLENASRDTTLPAASRAALSSALQEDAQERRRLNGPVGPSPLIPVPVFPIGPPPPAPVVIFPSDPAPIYPAAPTPVYPVAPAPVYPVTPAPVEPVAPAPIDPVAPATPAEPAAPPAPPAEYGLVVVGGPEGAAAAAGLRANDLILSVGGARTRSTADLRAAVTRAGAEVVVLVYLDGTTGEERQARVSFPTGRFGADVEPVQLP